MEHRFWGGRFLLYHPNSLALVGVVVAVRIGADRAFAVWQRLAATVLAGLVLLATNSRTGFVYLVAAAAVHAHLLWRRQGSGLPAYRRRWVAAAVPFAVLVAVLVVSGGRGFLFQARYGGDDPTSGRLDTWKQVGVEWQQAGWAEKLFGDAKTARAVVHRENDGAARSYVEWLIPAGSNTCCFIHGPSASPRCFRNSCIMRTKPSRRARVIGGRRPNRHVQTERESHQVVKHDRSSSLKGSAALARTMAIAPPNWR